MAHILQTDDNRADQKQVNLGKTDKVFGIILAAGQSTRFGQDNKLLHNWHHAPLLRHMPLLRHVYDAATKSALSSLVVVTGHEAVKVRDVLPEGARLCHNPHYSKGMATSIVCGVSCFLQAQEDTSLKETDQKEIGHKGARQGAEETKNETAAIMVLLGDMPLVTSDHINLLIKKYRQSTYASPIVVASCQGQWGNPVLFSARYVPQLLQLEGDKGARHLLNHHQEALITAEIGTAAKRDFDVIGDFIS